MPDLFLTTVRIRATRAKTLRELGVEAPGGPSVEVMVWGVPVAIIDAQTGAVLWTDDRLSDGESRAEFGQVVRAAVSLMGRANGRGVCEHDPLEVTKEPPAPTQSPDEALDELAELGDT